MAHYLIYYSKPKVNINYVKWEEKKGEAYQNRQ